MNISRVEIAIVVIIIAIYSVSALSIGRFQQTHSIIKENTCTSCHLDSVLKIYKNSHLDKMGIYSGSTDNILDYYNSSDMNGLCYSCHLLKYNKFGFKNFTTSQINMSGSNRSVAFIEDIIPFESNNSIRADTAIEKMKEINVETIYFGKNISFNNHTGYTCGTPDAMCHINQQIAIKGVENGNYYSHDMSLSGLNTCRTCHIYG